MTAVVNKTTYIVPRARPREAVEAGSAWRFCLVVEPAPLQASSGERLFTLDRAAVHALGRGATVLDEPFDPIVRVRFDWPAATQAEAIVAAIRAVESCELRVLRVDIDDWVTLDDIAHRVGRCRETVRLWSIGRTGVSGFPPPANPRRDTTFYSWAEVLPWLRKQKGVDLSEEDSALVAANLAVCLRAIMPRVAGSRVILDLFESGARIGRDGAEQ